MEKVKIEIDLETAEKILLSIKNLSAIKYSLSKETRISRFKKITDDKKTRKDLKDRYKNDVRECYFKYNKLKWGEMVKKTRLDIMNKKYTWYDYYVIECELREIKNEINPRKGQLGFMF